LFSARYAIFSYPELLKNRWEIYRSTWEFSAGSGFFPSNNIVAKKKCDLLMHPDME
jgi:hypothetical protein